ncbi:MAG: universal stress protein [Leptolyngbyaceae cyanobacterium bins.349]|nr:universal stress protein [Leptolyngbyaceae cyanobacterium bins.349]
MEILPMLVRLENALNCPDLAKQMVLVPRASLPVVSEDIHLVVGYNGSARSQTALDLTLWIAHQTRLVTQRAVTVQVVYVVDGDADRRTHYADYSEFYLAPTEVSPDSTERGLRPLSDRWEAVEATTCVSAAVRSPIAVTADWSDVSLPVLQSVRHRSAQQIDQFEKADRILWQARHLADEWRGSLKTHLRFGSLVEELRTVACQVPTTALILGCSSASDPLVQGLGQGLPFPVLGIPAKITGF